MLEAHRPWSSIAGAPLDLIKLVAAASMLVDHLNSALGTPPTLIAWRFGRMAFPLFCFVLAAHLARGVDPRSYLLRLLAVGVFTQPFFAAAFPWSPLYANILFTLAAGCALALVLAPQPAWISHGVFAAGAALVFFWPLRARTGVDFGIGGVMFAAALNLVLSGSRAHAPWFAVMLFGLNAGATRPGNEAWLVGTAFDAVYAAAGALAVIAAAVATSRGLPRFLPRYAFYAFYPGHLIALAAWRAWA